MPPGLPARMGEEDGTGGPQSGASVSEWEGTVDIPVDSPPAHATPMPQTLLALLAVFSAGILTLSQVENQHHTVESVVRDQFELEVSGTLLHTMEFVDARSFDAATTPARLRQRYVLPETMPEAERDTISFDDLIDIQPSDFSPIASFGGAPCNVQTPSTTACNDVDDISGNDWQTVDLKTPDGASLPVEVRVNVTYVESAESDVPVSYQTFHKRVEVFARTNVLRRRDGGTRPIEVALARVLSFDPKIAAEYLRRSIRVQGEGGSECEADVDQWQATMDALQAALSQAQATRDGVSNELASAQDALSQAQSAQASADDAAASAQSALQSARTTRDAAASDLSTAQSGLSTAQNGRTAAADAKASAQQRVGQAETGIDAAQAAVVAADEALEDAQDARADADADVAEAEETRDEAYGVAVEAYGVQDRAYNDAVDAFEEATYVDNRGRRQWRSPKSQWQAYYNQKYNAYVAAFNDFDTKRDVYYDAYYDAQAAQEAAEEAAQEVADAEAAVAAAADAVSAANAELTNARAAVDDAQDALDDAEAAVAAAETDVAAAESGLADAQATYDDASAAAESAAQAAAQAASATAAAQAEVDATADEWQDADDDVTDAQRDVDDHQSVYPQCEASA